MVRRIANSDLSAAFLERAQSLWVKVWPDKQGRSREELLDHYWKKFVVADTLEARTGVVHAVELEGELVGIARTFDRRIRFCESGRDMEVLALASVCVLPDKQGGGLGRLIVADCFERLKEMPNRFSCSLFQTPIPQFYEKIGSKIVQNNFINSLDAENPEVNPWWDKEVMIYPGAATWEKGRVDLLGKAY